MRKMMEQRRPFSYLFAAVCAVVAVCTFSGCEPKSKATNNSASSVKSSSGVACDSSAKNLADGTYEYHGGEGSFLFVRHKPMGQRLASLTRRVEMELDHDCVGVVVQRQCDLVLISRQCDRIHLTPVPEGVKVTGINGPLTPRPKNAFLGTYRGSGITLVVHSVDPDSESLSVSMTKPKVDSIDHLKFERDEYTERYLNDYRRYSLTAKFDSKGNRTFEIDGNSGSIEGTVVQVSR
jgi:hypothetical protein